MYLSRRHPVLVLFTLALLSACSPEATAPTQPLSGVYLLQQANGAPLPFVLSSGDRERYELLTESLTFHSHGEVLRDRTIFRTEVETGRDTIYTHQVRQAYRLRGQHLELGSFQPCPPDANCVGNDIGVASDQQIELQSGLYRTGPELPHLFYVRQ